ncbi:MAG: alpha/beta fold hydrolase [Verrucomicrobiota bacterium]
MIARLVFLAAIAPTLLNAQSLLERFDQLDRNRDGLVDAGELPRPELFQRFDRDGNGSIERSEISQPARPMREDDPRRMPEPPGLEVPPIPPHTSHTDIAYHEVEGVDPNLLSLDIYVPELLGESEAPVLVMIHGGGWRKGDKASPTIIGHKRSHFLAKGYLFVSINYRLSPDGEGPSQEGVKHPTHAEDCARALGWIHDHIAGYGGDPGQIHLMGHSAGGHLAAIVGTNERLLGVVDKELSILRSNTILDTAAINVPGLLEASGGRGMTALYHNAFGTDPETHLDASPFHHVESGKGIPPTILFYSNDRMMLDVFAPAFASKMREAGIASRAINTHILDHGQINAHVGMIGDPMTPLIDRLHAGEDAATFPTEIYASK